MYFQYFFIVSPWERFVQTSTYFIQRCIVLNLVEIGPASGSEEDFKNFVIVFLLFL